MCVVNMQWCPGTGSRVKQQSGSLNCDMLTHVGFDRAQEVACLVFLICFLPRLFLFKHSPPFWRVCQDLFLDLLCQSFCVGKGRWWGKRRERRVLVHSLAEFPVIARLK